MGKAVDRLTVVDLEMLAALAPLAPYPAGCNSPYTAAGIATHAAVSGRAASNSLRRLYSAGLVTKNPERTFVNTAGARSRVVTWQINAAGLSALAEARVRCATLDSKRVALALSRTAGSASGNLTAGAWVRAHDCTCPAAVRRRALASGGFCDCGRRWVPASGSEAR